MRSLSDSLVLKEGLASPAPRGLPLRSHIDAHAKEPEESKRAGLRQCTTRERAQLQKWIEGFLKLEVVWKDKLKTHSLPYADLKNNCWWKHWEYTFTVTSGGGGGPCDGKTCSGSFELYGTGSDLLGKIHDSEGNELFSTTGSILFR
ncbi:hypothetical protein BT96DRAFT_921115 [Gymnopus androsaceus JB14]|uniref:Uncharacterized protein n=1 Tax=Gymnopus androsaceus JB14 TaxID=1447944 RepID=A0A6A4HKE4_9AGAR|nr:hypothetical protein BT96DRAFT_921115 [Gymnopus androsaceus JB14]